MRDIKIYQDAQMLAGAAASQLCDIIRQTDSSRRCSIALSGGSTPGRMYDSLISMDNIGNLLNERAEFFFSDERSVGPKNPESNFALACDHLFEPAAIDSEIVHRMIGEADDLAAEADRYESVIRSRVPANNAEGIPQFDLTILGLGEDGHTASLFPELDMAKIEKSRRLVIVPYIASMKTTRLSFTFSLINCSRTVLFLVAGETKAEAVRQILLPDVSQSKAEQLPASMVSARSTIWMLDKAASSLLDRSDSRIRLS